MVAEYSVFAEGQGGQANQALKKVGECPGKSRGGVGVVLCGETDLRLGSEILSSQSGHSYQQQVPPPPNIINGHVLFELHPYIFCNKRGAEPAQVRVSHFLGRSAGWCQEPPARELCSETSSRVNTLLLVSTSAPPPLAAQGGWGCWEQFEALRLLNVFGWACM